MPVKFIQANIQHGKASTALLCRRLIESHTNIALIQEPWVYRGRIRGLARAKGTLYQCPLSENPRACILVKGAKDVFPLPGLCTRDLAVIKLVIGERNTKKEVAVCSAYFPGETESPPREFSRLVRYCEEEGLPLLVGCDSNSHHTMWGDKNVRARGTALLEFLTLGGLQVANRGSVPTYFTTERQSVIDLTLCTSELFSQIVSWEVSMEVSLSDHRHILFELDERFQLNETGYRNPKATRWDLYIEELKGRLLGIPSRYDSEEEVEMVVNRLNTAITESYEVSCPIKHRASVGKTPWWNSHVESHRKKVRKLFNKAKRTNIQNHWEDYKSAQREYKKVIRDSQRDTWRAYCEDIIKTSSAARLSKVLTKDPGARLGAVSLPGGGFTSSAGETLQHLLSVHFPNSTNAPPDEDDSGPHTTVDYRTSSKVVTYERLRWSIQTFSPFKSPGEDGILPALLQKGLDVLVLHLLRIFRICLARGYIPVAWRTVRVVFIPKPGKNDYTQAKSFRPISLGSFLLKALERLVDCYLREGILVQRPLHPHQYAYRAGRSVETALHHLVNRIDGVLERRQSALGVFIDIEGAFDNTSFNSMCQALERRGAEPSVIRWIGSVLSKRKVIARLAGSSAEAVVSRGCPQGGVLSPLLWCLVVDSLLETLCQSGFYAQAYADDLVILIQDQQIDILGGLLTEALLEVERWCLAEGLNVNPQKADLVIFTRKRKLGPLPEIYLAGKVLPYKGSTKYLGIILDTKLTWNEHIANRTKKATCALWACRRAFGCTWGLQPGILHWMYTAIVRPIITYGAIVWWPRSTKASTRTQLDRVQRLACLGITGAMRTAPTRAIEVLTGLPPLHLVIEHEAMRSAYRLTGLGHWKGEDQPHGHVEIWKKATQNCPVLLMLQDSMMPTTSPSQTLRIQIPERSDWEVEKSTICQHGIIWFTDGSKIGDKAGAGVYGKTTRTRLSFALGSYATVFQAEVYAILACGLENLKRVPKGKTIQICSDSQAALLAIQSSKVRSRLVLECKKTLNDLAIHNRVILTWVPGHSGVLGNEEADRLAREGSGRYPTGPEPILGVPYSMGVSAMKEFLNKEFENSWQEAPGMRQAKAHIRGPSLKLTKDLIGFNRRDLRMVTGLLTGHCHLNRHLQIIGIKDDSECRWCLEDEETSSHILTECPAIVWARERHFGSCVLNPKDVKDIQPRKLCTFAKEAGIPG